MADPIPADLLQAFEQALAAFVAWHNGDEPVVNIHGKPAPISAVVKLCEIYPDTMPTKLYWRLVQQANRFADRKPEARALIGDSSFETGARCLLQWIDQLRSRRDDFESPGSDPKWQQAE
jgi:hypothetical protein